MDLKWLVARATTAAALASVVLGYGCGDSAPPPDPGPSTTTTAVPPPPPPGPKPEDYITRERAGKCTTVRDEWRDKTGLCQELYFELQENASRGWRDLLVLAERCPWSLAPNPGAVFPDSLDTVEMKAELGAQLDRQGWGFMERLGEVNDRADPGHPEHDPRYAGRTNVRLSRFAAFRDQLLGHLAWSQEFGRNLEGQEGFGVRYDSVRGWCAEQ